MPREDVVYTCLAWVLTAPWVLIISLAIKPHTFLLSMICESQWVILTTQQLAEETPLPLLLSPPNRLQERAPSQGYPFDHDSLLQSERSWLARVDWRLFDLFINLSNLAQCCPQSLPAAPAPELQVHPLLIPPRGLDRTNSSAAWLWQPQRRGRVLRCEPRISRGPGAPSPTLPRDGQSRASARSWALPPAPRSQVREPARLLALGPDTAPNEPLSPQAAAVEHMGPVSWKHIKFKAVLVIGSVMFIPPLVDTTLAEATDNCLCFYCQLQ